MVQHVYVQCTVLCTTGYVLVETGSLRLWCVFLQGRDVTPEDMKDAILQLTVTEHYYTGVQDLVTLLCEFNDITVKVHQRLHRLFSFFC